MADDIKVITRNRKASFDYTLGEMFQAGLVLTGTEIKSIRANQVNLRDGFVEVREGEAWLIGVHVTPYAQAGIYGFVDPNRPRKLLLHKREIARINDALRERGLTCVPTMLFLHKGKAKVEIAIAKGKKMYDKRESIAKRDADRDIRQALKERAQE